MPYTVKVGIYTIQATLNYGWCKNSNQWIRKGDYKNKYANYVSVSRSWGSISGPLITMERYGKPSVEVVKKITKGL